MTPEEKRAALRQVAEAYFGPLRNYSVRDYDGPAPKEPCVALAVEWPSSYLRTIYGLTNHVVATVGVPLDAWEKLAPGRLADYVDACCEATRISIEERVRSVYVCLAQGKTFAEATAPGAEPELRWDGVRPEMIEVLPGGG